MMEMDKLPITKENTVILLLSLGIVVLFCALWLLPTAHRFQAISGELPAAEANLKEIAQVKALNDDLDKQIAALQQGGADGMPAKREPLRVEEASSFVDQIQQLAREHGLAKKEVRLQLDPVGKGKGQQLTVNAAFVGSAGDCQSFIDRLLNNAYVEQVNRISLAADEGGILLQIDFHIQLN